MKTTITSAIFILVFSVASVTTVQAQSAKNQITDTSLSASDNAPARRITAAQSGKHSTTDQVFDSTLNPESAAAAKRTQRDTREMQHIVISARQKPVKAGSNLDQQTTSSQKQDSTKINVGMVDAQ